jgi:multidrug efflux pump subunit AcrB
MMDRYNEQYVPEDIAGKLGKSFLRNPLTAVLGIVILALGWIALSTMPREEDPQIAISGGGVIIALPGASPREVENIISIPLESKLREIKGVENVYSLSMENVGILQIMYYIGEEREKSNLKLYDKVMQNMDKMPKGAMQPIIKPFDIDIDVPIVTIAFYQNRESNLSVADFNERLRSLKHDISGIENVAKTTLHGEHKKQYNVKINVDKLTGYHVSMGQVMMAIKKFAANTPQIKGKTSDGKIIMFGVKNAINDIEDIKNIQVSIYRGDPLYLKTIADVEEGIDEQNFRDVEFVNRPNNDTTQPLTPYIPQVTLSVSKLAGTNAVVVADNILELIEKNKEELEALGIEYKVTRNYGERANRAVEELMHHLLITIIIISIMLVFALGWRESIIVTFSVPAILAITLFIAYITGQTMNRITLFAFLLSLGLLVDAAIIVIENIHRHLHLPGAKRKEMGEILVEATDEVGSPTNVATLAIIMTMVPMAFVGGMMGSFMKPIPLNVPVALLASLFVAYIFTPYLSLKLLKKPKNDKEYDAENNPYDICRICQGNHKTEEHEEHSKKENEKKRLNETENREKNEEVSENKKGDK